MRLFSRVFLSIVVVLSTLVISPASAVAADTEYDIVVYGGTSGGVVAAVQAIRMGKTVILIEPTNFLGGLTTGGLGATDIGNKAAIGGISREFYQRIRKHYEDEANWKQEKKSEFKGRGHEANEDTGWTFEPHVALKIMNEFVTENKIPVVFGQRLDLKNGIKKDGKRITAIVMESGQTYKGKMFIDATYEGDLMAKAGVSYHVGREANKTYGETLNGIQVKHSTKHQFTKKVDPYITPGDPSSGLIPKVVAEHPGVDGDGDNKVQAYNYRLCATDREENRRAWPKPANYDEKQFELLLRNFEAGDHRKPWNPVLMPNRKTDSNNNYAFSTDNIGKNYDYPDGDYATRERIIKEHIDYQQGLMWTLANHPRVPEDVRKHYTQWGLAKDEFLDHDNWPRQMYVREARRMIGQYVMTESNCRGSRVVEDSVGMAAYTMDSHNIQRYVTKEGHILNEGDVQVGGFPPYPISYGSLVPKAEHCTNLFVPVCLSSTHIAFGSIRMEPVFMVMGQSAATAASMAIDDKVDVQNVDYTKLHERLITDKQVLIWKGARSGGGGGGSAMALAIKDIKGVVVDDADVTRKGFEGQGNSVGPYIGEGYRHDENNKRGEQWIRYTPDLPKAGKYEVRLAYSINQNRATNVPVTITHADGSKTVTVNQQKAPTIDKAFVSLGTFTFEKGKAGYVEISNKDVNGFVIADAVVFIAAE